jgi:hypothetical protein
MLGHLISQWPTGGVSGFETALAYACKLVQRSTTELSTTSYIASNHLSSDGHPVYVPRLGHHVLVASFVPGGIVD